MIFIKTITLKQPWATLVAEGVKKYEFRSWKCNYRGKILIHAGAGVDKEFLERCRVFGFAFPKKKILAEAEIIDCIKIDDDFNKMIKNMDNVVYGSKDRSGYAWVIDNVRKLNIDEEVNGKLSFWNYDV